MSPIFLDRYTREGYDIDGEIYSIIFEVVPKLSIDNGIELVREILKKCVFDETKCKEGITLLESYRKAWDDKRGCWRDSPLHDHTSHCADAFRYLAVSNQTIAHAKGLKIKW